MEIINFPALHVQNIPGKISVSKEIIEKNLVLKGDVLFNRTSETEDEIALSTVYLDEEPVIFGGFVIRGRPKNEKLTDGYKKYCFRSKIFRSALIRAGQGAVRSNIGQKDLDKIVITFPDKKEQLRIVSILETWDKAIEKIELKIAVKKKVKEGLTLRLLLGQFAANINRKFRKTRFFKVPENWDVVRIEDVATQVTEKNDQDLVLPVLSCTKHFGLVDSLKFFKKQVFSKKLDTYKIVQRDHFVYATNHIEEGSIGLQNLYEAGLVSPMYTVFQVNERILSTYLYALLKTELFRCIFEASTSASVDRRGSLRWKVFKKIEIPLSPIEEQKLIAQILTKADNEISALIKKLLKLKEQRDFLLNSMISGRIRTPENMSIS